MKKVLLVGALVVSVGGCAKLAKLGQDLCQGEETAHAYYVSFVAPFRPASAVALELKRYTTVHNLCATGAPPSQIQPAAANSDAARN